MKHWLMKTEPDEFSIADLATRGTEPWSGVRNPMARNFMRAMAIDDAVLFYHSSCEPPGVAGLAKVCATSHVDASQFDRKSAYYDANSKPEAPRWDCVDVAYVATFTSFVTLAQIRADRALAEMMLLRWSRLSVQPVTPAEYARIVALGNRAATPQPSPAAKPPRSAAKPPRSAAKPQPRSAAKPAKKVSRGR
jgi:predicted RNA-binding protein with PUA-like domain